MTYGSGSRLFDGSFGFDRLDRRYDDREVRQFNQWQAAVKITDNRLRALRVHAENGDPRYAKYVFEDLCAYLARLSAADLGNSHRIDDVLSWVRTIDIDNPKVREIYEYMQVDYPEIVQGASTRWSFFGASRRGYREPSERWLN